MCKWNSTDVTKASAKNTLISKLEYPLNLHSAFESDLLFGIDGLLGESTAPSPKSPSLSISSTAASAKSSPFGSFAFFEVDW